MMPCGITNHKHLGATGERRDMRSAQLGVRGECDLIILGAIKLGGGGGKK